jgi:glycosyltransferase involved in cell wall biosynthesis
MTGYPAGVWRPSSQVKVLFVSELFPPVSLGGAEIAARELAAEIGRKHEVAVFTPSYNGPAGMQYDAGFGVFRYRNVFVPMGSALPQKMLFITEMTKHLAAFVKAFRPDLLHAQNLMSAPSVARVSEMFNIPGVAHIRDHRFECFTSHVQCRSHQDATILEFARCVDSPLATLLFPYAKLITKTLRSALKKLEKAFAVSHYMQHELLRTLPLDARTCYDGVDLGGLRKARSLPWVGGYTFGSHQTLAYAGGLHKFKGIRELLHAFLQISKKNSGASLLIAGDGPLRREVWQFVRVNGLNQRVILLGRLTHESTISILKASGVVAVPSLLPEACSRLVIEALACGKPVVASNRGANAELIGKAGLVCEPNAESIAEAVTSLMQDTKRSKEMSLSASERAEEFSISRTSLQILESYDAWRL